MCYCLTISKLNDHPSYQNWTPQKGRFAAFENAKYHLSSVFSFVENEKLNVELNLEELLKYSYGMLQKRKATQIIEKELGHSISPLLVNASQEYLQRKKDNKLGDELSGSML